MGLELSEQRLGRRRGFLLVRPGGSLSWGHHGSHGLCKLPRLLEAAGSPDGGREQGGRLHSSGIFMGAQPRPRIVKPVSI